MCLKTIRRIFIFNDTLRRIQINKELKELTISAKNNTILYKENDKLTVNKGLNDKAKISVVNERTLAKSLDLKKAYNKVAVLNFASATYPGGGVKLGSSTQEESLCRCSNLYQSISQKWLYKEFYKPNRRYDNFHYTDSIIFSKDVTVFKTDTSLPQYTDEWFNVDVITSPAPNLTYKKIDDELKIILTKRITRILDVAIDNNEEAIVLGAFGCGAFSNPPLLVATVFKEVLQSGYDMNFKEIVFAVLSTNNRSRNNFDVFKSVLENSLLR